jgi:monofunctional biosynthetic peptidoglycan transglycosylase
MKSLARALLLVLCAGLLLQLFFVLRIALMVVVDPESTAFQRSEAWQLLRSSEGLRWSQEWQPYDHIAPTLKRAVIASEDDSFTEHHGVQWEAVEKAWQRNQRAEARAQKADNGKAPKIYGGSTITQQLAKNLWLSSERSYPRKGQELLLAKELETLLPKRRILEIYLNNVEWGEGVFGAEAAARHHFKKPASALTPMEAARLAVMLPRPKFFERRPGSAYVQRQSGRIAARMRLVAPP